MLALAGAAYWWFTGSGASPTSYRLAKVERGDIRAIVNSSGTVNPTTAVQVGSQVSGQIRDLLVDFNTEVKRGDVLARIDPESFELRVRQAEADLEAAKSAVLTQRASLAAVSAEAARAGLTAAEARRDLGRKQELYDKTYISAAELDRARVAAEVAAHQDASARAQLAVGEAGIKSALANVAQRQAALAQARVDLERTVIRSPVDGVVVQRSIDAGQTVAASFQAPVLFTIARNLTEMQVDTAIDEADIGRIRLGMPAEFSVDAHPGRTFLGNVAQVRKAATVLQNVVTYTVVIKAANADLALLPGMTANVKIEVARKNGVLRVPNAALRFEPGPPGAGPHSAAARSGSQVWVLDGEQARPLAVQVGLTDGEASEITGGGLSPGQQVIVGRGATAGGAHGGGKPGGQRWRL